MLELDDWGLLDNWITAREFPKLNEIHWTPNPDVVDLMSLNVSPQAFKQYRIDAAERLAATMGNKPVLAISGGVDSQAMLQSFLEAGIEVSLACMTFKNNFNDHDVVFAEQVAAKHDLPLLKIELDVLRFLNKSLWDYAETYECGSPQFACHNWFFEQLIEQGFTGIACGGHAWRTSASQQWFWANTSNRHNWLKFSRKNNFPCHGNFLASTWQLNFSLAVCAGLQFDDFVHNLGTKESADVNSKKQTAIYPGKISAYTKFGFNLLPQADKFTGFEKVKAHVIASSDHDAWAFETRYRHPIELQWPALSNIKLKIDDAFGQELNNLWIKCQTSDFDKPDRCLD
jgi:hypothetical protein